MPNTAKRLGYNPYRLNENIKAGLTYYKMMYKMFGSTELALAAYNAGPGNVKKYGGTIPPFKETKRFVNVIMQDYNNMKTHPDPFIIKYIEKVAALAECESKVEEAEKPFDLPELNEIPEVRQTDAIMEIL